MADDLYCIDASSLIRLREDFPRRVFPTVWERVEELIRAGRVVALDVPSLPWLQEALRGGLTKGGIYLIAGEPGIGKTTLAAQILIDLAKRGVPVVIQRHKAASFSVGQAWGRT